MPNAPAKLLKENLAAFKNPYRFPCNTLATERLVVHIVFLMPYTPLESIAKHVFLKSEDMLHNPDLGWSRASRSALQKVSFTTRMPSKACGKLAVQIVGQAWGFAFLLSSVARLDGHLFIIVNDFSALEISSEYETPSSFLSTVSAACRSALCNRRNVYREQHQVVMSNCQHQRQGQRRQCQRGDLHTGEEHAEADKVLEQIAIRSGKHSTRAHYGESAKEPFLGVIRKASTRFSPRVLSFLPKLVATATDNKPILLDLRAYQKPCENDVKFKLIFLLMSFEIVLCDTGDGSDELYDFIGRMRKQYKKFVDICKQTITFK